MLQSAGVAACDPEAVVWFYHRDGEPSRDDQERLLRRCGLRALFGMLYEDDMQRYAKHALMVICRSLQPDTLVQFAPVLRQGLEAPVDQVRHIALEIMHTCSSEQLLQHPDVNYALHRILHEDDLHSIDLVRRFIQQCSSLAPSVVASLCTTPPQTTASDEGTPIQLRYDALFLTAICSSEQLLTTYRSTAFTSHLTTLFSDDPLVRSAAFYLLVDAASLPLAPVLFSTLPTSLTSDPSFPLLFQRLAPSPELEPLLPALLQHADSRPCAVLAALSAAGDSSRCLELLPHALLRDPAAALRSLLLQGEAAAVAAGRVEEFLEHELGEVRTQAYGWMVEAVRREPCVAQRMLASECMGRVVLDRDRPEPESRYALAKAVHEATTSTTRLAAYVKQGVHASTPSVATLQ